MASVDAVASVLIRATSSWAVSVVARDLAVAGVPVFPCLPGGKRPLTEHGFHDATTDLEQIVAWWQKHPTANLAVPTGAASGVMVVDVDVHGPVDGYRAFERAHRTGLVSGWQFLVATPSGGMHAYYPATPGRELNRPRFDAASFRVWKEDDDHAEEDSGGDEAARYPARARSPR